jgi:phosphatidylglycerol:prolipoprotein diacylglycerol transferase
MITPDEGEGFFVPTQLYEALFLFVLAGLMTFLLFKRCNIIMSVYLILYGIWRFIIEYFRHDYRGGLPGLTPSQGMSIAFVAMGIALIIVYLIVKLPIVIKREKQEDDKLEN